MLAGVEKRYAGITRWSGTFRQEGFNTTFGRTDRADGRLMLQRPGRLRLDYFAGNAVSKSFIVGRSTLYVVDLENEQVVRKDPPQNLLTAVVWFQGHLSEEFSAELDRSGIYGTAVLKLTPRSASPYSHLFLVVDPQSSTVLEAIVFDTVGNRSRFWFTKHLLPFASDHHFELDETSPALAGYRIIDAQLTTP